MSGGFEGFTEAVTAASRGTRAAPAVDPLTRIAVLGGGPDARLLAGLALAEGAEVTLFSAYGRELDLMRTSSGITLRGTGPIGTFHVDRDTGPSIRTTAELDHAVAGAQVIFLTGPIHKQRTYAMVLADHLSEGQILVLAPGRSLGALETAWYLRIGGCGADVTVVECQGLPFWYRADGAQLTLTNAGPVAAATLPRGRDHVLDALRPYLPNIVAKDSVLASGFADGSALVEVPALMLGGPAVTSGAAPIPMGGQALPGNETFAALIGAEQRALIARLAAERHRTAHAFGVRDLPDVDAWIATHAGALRGDDSRPVPGHTEAHALLRDGVIGSLVPLMSAAAIAGIDVPATRAMVTTAATILGADIAAAGRRLDTIGIDAGDIDSARRAMDAIATRGAR